MLAGAGVVVSMSDLFGVEGTKLLARVRLPTAAGARVNSALRLIETLDFEVELFAKLLAGRLRTHGGYTAIQAIPGVGPVLGAVFARRDRRCGPLRPSRAAGQLGRADPETPRVRHHRAPRPDHQAGLPAGPLSPRSRPCNDCLRTPDSAELVTASAPAAAATSASSPRPGS